MPPPPHPLFCLLLQVTCAQVSRQTGAGSASKKPSCIPPSKGSRCMHMLSELSHFTRLATERWVKGFTTVPPKEPLAGLTSVWVAVGACCRAACGLQLHHQTSLQAVSLPLDGTSSAHPFCTVVLALSLPHHPHIVLLCLLTCSGSEHPGPDQSPSKAQLRSW